MSDSAAALDSSLLTRRVLEAALELGFHRCGVAPVAEPDHYDAYQRWLESGLHGEMAYMARADHRQARRDPAQLLPGARSAIVVALAHAHDHDRASAPDDSVPGPRGSIARYAWGQDYHHVIKGKLFQLADRLSQLCGYPAKARPCVDSAPLLERALAHRAGLGGIGKNTMLIAPGLGSYVLLGVLLTDVALVPAPANEGPPLCGSCTACVDSCPTGAFAAPYILDARRCISYLTIEHRGAIPDQLRPQIGERVFGCDVCQEVCPFNARAPARSRPAAELLARDIEHTEPSLVRLAEMGANQRRRFSARSALRRVNRAQLMRNVAVALGNSGDPRAAGAVDRLRADSEPLIAEHARWAAPRLRGAARTDHHDD